MRRNATGNARAREHNTQNISFQSYRPRSSCKWKRFSRCPFPLRCSRIPPRSCKSWCNTMPWRTLFSDWVHLVVQSWWWSCYLPWTGPVGSKVVCWYVRGYTTSRIPGHWSGQNFQSSTLKIRYYSFSKHCIHISIVFNAAITDRYLTICKPTNGQPACKSTRGESA